MGWNIRASNSGRGRFAFSRPSRLVLEHTQPLVQWILGLFPWGKSGLGTRLITCFHQVSRLRISEDVQPLILYNFVGTQTHSQFVFHTNNPRPFWGPSPNNPQPFWEPSPNTSPVTALAVSDFWPITDLLILTNHRLVYSDQLQNSTTTLKTV